MSEEFHTRNGEIVEVRQSKCVQCSTEEFEWEAREFTQNELRLLLSSQEYQQHQQRNQQSPLHDSPDSSTDKINAKEAYVKVFLLEGLIFGLFAITLSVLGLSHISSITAVSVVILFVTAITRTGHVSAIILPLVLVDHSQQVIGTGRVVIRGCIAWFVTLAILLPITLMDELFELALPQNLTEMIVRCLSFAITDYLLGYRFALRKTSLWETVERSKWYNDLELFITCYLVIKFVQLIEYLAINMSGDEEGFIQ